MPTKADNSFSLLLFLKLRHPARCRFLFYHSYISPRPAKTSRTVQLVAKKKFLYATTIIISQTNFNFIPWNSISLLVHRQCGFTDSYVTRNSFLCQTAPSLKKLDTYFFSIHIFPPFDFTNCAIIIITVFVRLSRTFFTICEKILTSSQFVLYNNVVSFNMFNKESMLCQNLAVH